MKLIISNTQKGKSLVYIFIFSAIISFFYAIFTQTYNGDFLGIEVKITTVELIFNLFTSIIPFIFLYFIYLRFSRTNRFRKKIQVPMNFFFKFLVIIMGWNIIVTLLYGVGIMGADAYTAPQGIKLVIQIMNRFNYLYGAFVFILCTKKSDKRDLIILLLLLILAYFRAGLGSFMYIGMIMFIKYNFEVRKLYSRNKIKFLVCIICFPLIVSTLYAVRNSLRNQEEDYSNPVTGKFFGRMSSFSDSAMILQESAYFSDSVKNLDFFYFQKQALGVFSVELIPKVRPEIMVFKLYYGDLEDNVAYMAGTQGNLYISYLKSPILLVINILSFYVYIIIIFRLFQVLKFEYNMELALILSLYVVMSGVSNEFAFIILSILVYIILFYFINTFTRTVIFPKNRII
ncbi:oligosaccharide repeat unit polymerase [Chryseobacterium gotjawalense]|uniref:Oligosaccharide repeat unit polymerase n=1 Tax=Chryseobacterium gotjawalense TaxID=3042315 RepID=A0ABY8RGF2_9FLAO|nr:oligosaccharide repeat unit polymerase [Chryseobacterium sp. wdc7]WHF53055.1 oligosaccharide repeat unit polymerase [Chryseobacterium sp. wdc7]